MEGLIKKKHLWTLFLFLLLLLSLEGCFETGTNEADQFKVISDHVADTEKVDYGMLKEFVLDTNGCTDCHGEGGSAGTWAHSEEGLKTQFVPGKPEESPLYTEVADGSMPLGEYPPLNEGQRDLVRRYIVEFSSFDTIEEPVVPAPTPAPAPTPVPTPAPGPAVLAATYTSLKTHLYEKSCTMCHSQGSGWPVVPLDNYDDAKENAELSLESIESGFMPLAIPGNPPEIPSNEVVEKLKEWIDLDYPL